MTAREEHEAAVREWQTVVDLEERLKWPMVRFAEARARYAARQVA